MTNAPVLSGLGLGKASSLNTEPVLFGSVSMRTGMTSPVRVPINPTETTSASSVVDNDARRLDFLLQEILRQVERRMIASAREMFPDIEQDIWSPIRPKSTITINTAIEFEGRAKPRLFVDWLEED